MAMTFTLDYTPLSNSLGTISLALYVVTVLPSILRIVFPQTKSTKLPKKLLQHRRTIGILAFVFALAHGFILAKKRDIDLLDLKTSWVYIQGVATFAVFTILAITSNNWSVKKLKAKNWKNLHKLTYLAMFLITWHVWDKMADHWSYLTPIGLVAIVTINVLFLVRRYIEHQQQKAKAQKANKSLPKKAPVKV